VAPSGQHWDPERYRREAGFVAELGRPLFDLLHPAAGDSILDLGCGDGRLTAELAATGARVVGCDLAVEQVVDARRRNLDAVVADAARLPFAARSFDAVLSNAALHWMRDSAAVLAETARVLRPGGRFVGELGGAGNVAAIVGVIAAAMARRGLDVAAVFPWTFPTPARWRGLLQDAGFEVSALQHFARPTPLPADIRGWLNTFAESFLNALPAGERAAFLDEVAVGLEPALKQPDGSWVADYVRLRFAARRAA
jgi:SAM-dependent methyltransferase